MSAYMHTHVHTQGYVNCVCASIEWCFEYKAITSCSRAGCPAEVTAGVSPPPLTTWCGAQGLGGWVESGLVWVSVRQETGFSLGAGLAEDPVGLL